MNILILGGGGREHALAWAVKQNPKCDHLIVAPGNAGMQTIAECVDLDINDDSAVVAYAKLRAIDFVIIGPEAPLVAGVADALRAAGILTFGPDQAAAKLEASKHFTKQVCEAAGAPTAAYGHFTDAVSAKAFVREQGAPIVVKADGLAAGKGVVVAMEVETALQAIDDMFGGQFGQSGAEVVVEEFMDGEEASFFVLCDGTTVLPIGTAQDHKRVGEGDTGPNTGGMGAYSPAPVLSPAIEERALKEIIEPTVAEMARRGSPYKGVLYAGLMIKDDEPRLVEYNVRFGDPECQVLMLRLGAQALDLLLATANEELDKAQVNWADDHAVFLGVEFEDVQRVGRADAKAFALADGVKFDAVMMPEHAAVQVDDFASMLFGEAGLLQEAAIVIIRHETNLHALFLVGSLKIAVAGDIASVAFSFLPQRK